MIYKIDPKDAHCAILHVLQRRRYETLDKDLKNIQTLAKNCGAKRFEINDGLVENSNQFTKSD